MRSSSRRSKVAVEFWPGFVDALSTLLIVIMFMILVFVLAQFFLNQAISNKDDALARLNSQINQLSDLLALERANSADLRVSVGQLTADLQASAKARDEALARVAGLASERDALVARLNEVTNRINEANARAAQSAAQANKASRDLEEANRVVDADREKITLQLADLEQLRRDIEALKTVRADLEKQVAGLNLALAQRDSDLGALRDHSKELEAKLASEQERTQLAQKDVSQNQIRLAELLTESSTAKAALDKEKQVSSEARAQIDLLNQQIAALRQQLQQVSAALDLAETKNRDQDVQILDLGKRLNAALATKVQELARYRSEFFGKLREVLGDRPDVRIVGDRFVFQSEVLFQPGSADLGDAGREQLGRLAQTLRELLPQIPSDLQWVLRVDGHTDNKPIHTAQFPSNWELSTERAISVVRFLMDQGVPADRLAATGFAEYQPIDRGDDDAALRRNRRIELKLTDR